MTSESSQDQSRFYCHCGKSFIRKEHLKRHESSHSLPSFVCSVCQRSFTRNDLLRRHVALHGSKGAPAPRRAKACNACHESKVKCDGGERCSLCVKRDILCSYERDGQTDSAQDSSTSSGSPDASHIDFAEAERGLATMVNLLKNGAEVPTQVGLPKELLEVSDWWEQCSDKYRLGFHNHWPILHYPTIQDFPRNSVWNEASIAMVATWATFGPGSVLRERALEIHDHLTVAILNELMGSPVDDLENQPWPWEMWCVALINVVFALETGRAGLIRRADRVFDMVLTDCRQRRAFCVHFIRRNQAIHMPGEFFPWKWKNWEQFNKIAAVMFKIDTCLFLTDNRAPRIRREELIVMLPVPFTHWNAFGLGQHFERWPRQIREPEKYTISQLLRSPSIEFPVFYEDIQLILCEAAQWTWQLAQTRKADLHVLNPVESLQPMDIKKKLILCCKELRRLARAINEPDRDPDTRQMVLWAYTGKEEPGDPGWEETVLARVLSMYMSSLMLQCLGNMHLHSDIEFLKMQLTRSKPPSQDELRDNGHLSVVAVWAHSPDGRLAFLHAMATFVHYAKRSLAEYAVHTDICTALAMTTAAVVMQQWLGCILLGDEARAREWGQGEYNLKADWLREAKELPEEVIRWAETGTPIAAVDGWPLSTGMYGHLMSRILDNLKFVRETWPMCEPVAAALEVQARMHQ